MSVTNSGFNPARGRPSGLKTPRRPSADAPAIPVVDRRLDPVIHSVSPINEAWCCDVTLVSPLTALATPGPEAPALPRAALPGPLTGRWSSDCLHLTSLSGPEHHPPCALRAPAAVGCSGRGEHHLRAALTALPPSTFARAGGASLVLNSIV